MAMGSELAGMAIVLAFTTQNPTGGKLSGKSK
jgi:hypothetical protein